MKRAALTGIALVALCLGGATSLSAQTPTPQPATAIQAWKPDPSDATLSYTGSCWEGSLASNRVDAWRCMTDSNVVEDQGGNLFDPCFGDSSSSAVYCPILSATSQSIVTAPLLGITLDVPLDAGWPACAPSDPTLPPQSEALCNGNNPAATPNPLALQLADGTTCNLDTATGAGPDLHYSYDCLDGSALVGALVPGRVWSAQRLPAAAVQQYLSCWTANFSDPGGACMKTVLSRLQGVSIATVWQ